ncbi:MAG: TlpA disulfide reductase family protein [bacterium]|nr:TlpA disulfide reductase family protein [bacterium]
MRWLERSVLIGAAYLCFGAAAWLLIKAELPHRAAYTGQISEGQRPTAPEINAFAPNFERQALDGDLFNLRDLRGSPVVLNFWATWCEPCRVEMPELEALSTIYQENNLRVVGVNVGETASLVQPWVDSLGLTFEIVLDERQSVAALYYLRGMPSTIIISPEGIITHIFYGPVTRATLERALAPYLAR